MPSEENTFDAANPVWRGLAHARRIGRIGHAYLLVGDDVDVLEKAVVHAVRIIACPEPDAEGRPCGRCDLCRQTVRGTWPDMHIVRPSTKTRQIPIDAVRNLEAQLRLASAPGSWRFGIIVEADQLNDAAQNAFLKTLEEPPGQCILLLATTKPQRLLPTIRSRCQRLNVYGNRPNYEEAARLGVFQALALLRPGSGSDAGLATARKLLEIFAAAQTEAAERVDAHGVGADWEVLAEEDPAVRKRLEQEKKLAVAAEYARLRQIVLEAILSWFRQIEILAAGGSWENLAAPEMFENAGLDRERVLKALEQTPTRLVERASRLAERLTSDLAANVNEQLALYTFCLGVSRRT